MTNTLATRLKHIATAVGLIRTAVGLIASAARLIASVVGLTLPAGALLPAAAQVEPTCRVMDYEHFNDAAAGVVKIVRDAQGMLWLGTQDGLYRYDGYDFHNFKARAGDGIDMSSNSIANLFVSSENALWCLIEDRVFLFDLATYRYVDVLASLEQGRQHYRVERLRPLACGTTWVFTADGTIIAIDDKQPATSARVVATGEDLRRIDVACDARGRSWILTSAATYVYHDGRLTSLGRAFSRVAGCGEYVFLLQADGTLCHCDDRMRPQPLRQADLKPVDHLTRLSDDRLALTGAGGVQLITADGRHLSPTDVSWPVRKLVEDSSGRLWMLAEDGSLSMADSEGRHVQHVEGVALSNFNLYTDNHATMWFVDKHGDIYYALPQHPTQLHHSMQAPQLSAISNTLNDGQGGCWLISDKRLCRLSFGMPAYHDLPLAPASQARGMAADARGRLLVGTRFDQRVTLVDSLGHVTAYLRPDGTLTTEPATFGASVYRIFRDSRDQLWLGTKSDGIFRLRPTDGEGFAVLHLTRHNSALPDDEVYDFAEDATGRLWIATHRGGLACVADLSADTPRLLSAASGLSGWDADCPPDVNALLVTPGQQLLVGTGDGLYVADLSAASPAGVSFRRHVREASRAASLSSNSISHLLLTSDGRLFISTESDGVNELLSASPLQEQLDFRHYDRSTGFPTDMTGKMAEYQGTVWVTAPDRLVGISLRQPGGSPHANSFLLGDNPHFAISLPTRLSGSQWVFGTDRGAAVIDLNSLSHTTFTPPLVVTGVSIENKPLDFTAASTGTVTLQPGERNLTLWFAALDFENTEHVNYAYRLGDDDSPWTYIGHNRSIALPQLSPATYRLTLRSTNSDGMWTGGELKLTILVRPTFWQTPWALLLVVLLTAAVIAAVAYTLLYIRRIKRQQHDTLEQYLALLGQSALTPADATLSPTPATLSPTDAALSPTDAPLSADDPFMRTFVAYVESNLGNSDVTVDDLAAACAVSRTGLHRKVKRLLGQSPMEFLREARIRKANALLSQTAMTVSEIAYECGFSDPKYFSKCFKAATGKTPTEYKRDT